MIHNFPFSKGFKRQLTINPLRRGSIGTRFEILDLQLVTNYASISYVNRLRPSGDNFAPALGWHFSCPKERRGKQLPR